MNLTVIFDRNDEYCNFNTKSTCNRKFFQFSKTGSQNFFMIILQHSLIILVYVYQCALQ